MNPLIVAVQSLETVVHILLAFRDLEVEWGYGVSTQWSVGLGIVHSGVWGGVGWGMG